MARLGIAIVLALLNVGPAQAADGEPAFVLKWHGSEDAKVSLKDGRIIVISNGHDPYLFTEDVAPLLTGGVLAFRMKSNCRGDGQVFWSTRESPHFTQARQVKFATTGNNLWHRYMIEIPPVENLVGLRLDPGGSKGEIEIESLRLIDRAGFVVKQWLPEQRNDQESRIAAGDATIRSLAEPSEIVITTTSRLAGAIHSLTWNGREFIDSFDHGRQLQSACSFGGDGPFHAECFNPTEAGSRMDGRGGNSSSRLLFLAADARSLQTTTQAAFWLAPWELSEGKPARNRESRSQHLISKQVQIGFRDLSHVLDYHVTFRVPVGEEHTFGQFEALTGYMPAEFNTFWKFNPQSQEFESLSDGPGEQPWPVVLATSNGSHAMGIFSPPPKDSRFGLPSYGRWRFGAEKVVKWNCVYRLRDPASLAPGDYAFQNYVVVGDLEKAKHALIRLREMFSERATTKTR